MERSLVLALIGSGATALSIVLTLRRREAPSRRIETRALQRRALWGRLDVYATQASCQHESAKSPANANVRRRLGGTLSLCGMYCLLYRNPRWEASGPRPSALRPSAGSPAGRDAAGPSGRGPRSAAPETEIAVVERRKARGLETNRGRAVPQGAALSLKSASRCSTSPPFSGGRNGGEPAP